MAKVETKEVAVKEAPGLPAFIGAVEETGFEETTANDYSIPFLRIVQQMSPQLKKSDPGYVKGCEEGDLFNTATGEVIPGSEGVLVVPCLYEHQYLLWAPNRGGLKGRLTVDEYATCSKQKAKDQNGNEVEINQDGNVITDTRSYYVLLLRENGVEPAIISMSSTQLKKSKKWMTQMQNIKVNSQTLPMWSQVYKVTTVTDPGNEKGTWMGWNIVHERQIGEAELYNAATAFRGQVKSGAVKAQEQEVDTSF